MEVDNFFVHNLETDKLNIHTSKVFYEKLSEDEKKIFKQFCLWSRKQECWISKGKARNAMYLKSKLKELGFADGGTTGERLSFQEQVRREQEKAAAKAERAEQWAEKAEQRSEAFYKQAKEMASVIPFGQPILVGHYSEQRDRNYRNRIHNTFGKAFAEQDKAAYYNQKAEIAKQTANGKKYADPGFLGKRISECDKNIRLYERRLKGKLYPHSPEKQISEKARIFFNKKIKEEQEKLEYYQKSLKQIRPESSGEIIVTTRKTKGQVKGIK